MATEASKAIVRMGANYVRLILSVLMGLAFFRMCLEHGGKDVTALIILLGSSAGIAAVFIDIMNASLVREVGSAWHNPDRDVFASVYNSAIALCVALIPPTLVITFVLMLVVPVLDIDSSLIRAAQIYVLTRGIELSLVLLLTCPVRMYQVKEHFVWANLIELLRRASQLIAGIIIFLIMKVTDPASALVLFGVISTGLIAIVLVGFGSAVMVLDRTLVPTRSLVRIGTIKQILASVKWNAGVIFATSIHLPAAQFVMNLVFGLIGNLAFGFAQVFSAYVLRLTVGTTDGLDAVSVRLSSRDESGRATQVLFHHATRLQTLVACSAGMMVAVYAQPLMSLWLGKKENAEEAIPLAAPLTAVIMLGIVSRAISEGWMRILYGAGYVDRYAKLVMAGAVFSPVLAVLLSILLPSEPAIIGEYGPNFAGAAAAYAITIFIFQLVLLPRVAARCLRMRIRDTFKPMVAPLAIVLVASPILLVARYVLEWTSFLGSVVSCGLYGCAVCVLFGLFGLSREERHRFTGAMLRRMSRSRGEITQ